jgi:hypothetical protein
MTWIASINRTKTMRAISRYENPRIFSRGKPVGVNMFPDISSRDLPWVEEEIVVKLCTT